jgi:hypothetical protein
MDEVQCPVYGEFEKYKYKKDIQHIQNYSASVLVYEYVKYCLLGAELKREDGTSAILTNPISVSKHTFVDIVHAISFLSRDGPPSFHLTALLFEQLAYQTNPDASYPREF